MLLKYPFLFFVLFVSMAFTKHCCEKHNKGQIPGRLEAYVILGIGEPPECVIANPKPKVDLIEKNIGENVPIWSKAVFFDSLNTPIPNREIKLDVVDAFGDEVPISNAVLSSTTIKTNELGFNESSLSITGLVFGVFRVRATYDDKHTKAVSYSPLIQFR